MTSFAEKSQQSIQAAGLLLTSNLYPSSINRSYYSFFQFMMHVLFNKIKMDQHSFHTHIHCSGKKNAYTCLEYCRNCICQKQAPGIFNL